MLLACAHAGGGGNEKKRNGEAGEEQSMINDGCWVSSRTFGVKVGHCAGNVAQNPNL